MTNPLIKICGIRDPDMATQAVAAGVHFIGILFHPLSLRQVDQRQAKKIAQATIKAGAIPVAVFVDHDADAMRHICELTHIKTVQLHGTTARTQHHLLPDDYQRIYVHTAPYSKTDDGLQHLAIDRDFILIDHSDSGQGKQINWQAFQYDLPFRWLLAGGLTPDNVMTAMHILQPHGVDVSSGVESSKANKDIFLIQQFIQSVRGVTYGK